MYGKTIKIENNFFSMYRGTNNSYVLEFTLRGNLVIDYIKYLIVGSYF